MFFRTLLAFAVVTGCCGQSSCITGLDLSSCATQLTEAVPLLRYIYGSSIELEMIQYFDRICRNPVPLQNYYKCSVQKLRSCFSGDWQKTVPSEENMLSSFTYLCNNLDEVDLDCFSSKTSDIHLCTVTAFSKGYLYNLLTLNGYTDYICSAYQEITSCYRTELNSCPLKTSEIMTEHFQYEVPPACGSGCSSDANCSQDEICAGRNGSKICVADPCKDETCNGNGICEVEGLDSSSQSTKCTCNLGYEGSNCEDFICSFDGDCPQGMICFGTSGSKVCIADPCSGETCSGNGNCVVEGEDSSSPRRKCTCNSGYLGNDCAYFACSFIGDCPPDNICAGRPGSKFCMADPCVDETCSGNGNCVVEGEDSSSPRKKCTCNSGYIGIDCTYIACSFIGDCPPDNICAGRPGSKFCMADPCSGEICNENENCVVEGEDSSSPRKKCTCNPGYIGLNCAYFACSFDGDCPPDKICSGSSGSKVCIADPCKDETCSGNGNCVVEGKDSSSPRKKCTCNPDFYGSDCSNESTNTAAGNSDSKNNGNKPYATTGLLSVIVLARLTLAYL